MVPSGLPIEIETRITWDQVDQVRIVPRANGYVVEVVYQQEVTQADVDPTMIAALDLGVNTLAACTSTKPGFEPLLINCRPLKSINQHAASRRIIDHLFQEGIGTLAVGKNFLWKQQVQLGRTNSQTFVQIPHARFIDSLTYKAKLVGIDVVIAEESYTSRASFLDLDAFPTYDPERTEKLRYSGKREKRGLYRPSDGRRIHADINGSYNILRKAFPNSFGQGIEAAAVRPRRFAI